MGVHREAYEAIGKYVAEFEIFVDSMRKCMLFFIPQDADPAEINIIVAGLTADNIRVKLQALINHRFSGNQLVLEYVNPVLNISNQIMGFRNKVVHGTWNFPWRGEELVEYFKLDKKGAEIANIDIEQLAREAEIARSTGFFFQYFLHYFLVHNDFEVFTTFLNSQMDLILRRH